MSVLLLLLNLGLTTLALCLGSSYIVFVKHSSKLNMSCIKVAAGKHHVVKTLV